ncbi:adenosine 5'-monophosphoramidase HINT3-like [Periophthalmus magnuspinnatus]|uniref:adenosine 5'-monophosphoramidase HINT3-like n=1 Tax=Periophthalmus magnuspinnatus TaxID=409849 RepID=UPI00145ABA1B|nr:adenosine 5'-monophosphoramidase HINT3-like [Periophthalmus magnuspinnatus]
MDEDCIFCIISKGEDKETEILKQDEELMCFRDINPAAPHHYLIIPKVHIVSCLCLQWYHHSLVERMAEMGKAVLLEQGVSDMTDIKLGFHIPPYTSVNHLHLHVVAPTEHISHYLRYKFTPGERFVEVDYFQKILRNSQPHSELHSCCPL